MSLILSDNLADIFIIAETKLDNSFFDAQFHIANYSLYRNDRNVKGGGVMTYINSAIPHRVRKDLNINITGGLEGSVFEMCLNKKKWLIAGLYKPPSVSDSVFKDTFCKLYEEMYDDCSNCIVTGDLNLDMTKDNVLSEICNIYGLKNKIIGHTCFKGDTHTSLDVFLVNNSYKFGTSLNVDIGVSDFHNIIGCCLKCKVPKTFKKVIKYRSYKKFNLDKFHEDLGKFDFNECLKQDNAHQQMSRFNKSYSDLVNKHIPLKTKTLRKPQVPFMNSNLKHAIFKKAMLRNKYYKVRTSENWENYRKQRNCVTKLRKQSIRAYFQKKCEGDNNKMNFWQTVKPFLSNKTYGDSQVIILKEGENIVSDPNNVCQIFNEYFANVAMTIGFCENISFKNDIQNVLNKYRDHTSIRKIKENITHDTIFCFKHVNEETVYKSLKELELKKASGYDEISPKIVKYSIDYLVPFLTCVINRCIDDCIFPNDLKLAEISSIYKKNDKLDKENYRPVSVLIVLS